MAKKSMTSEEIFRFIESNYDSYVEFENNEIISESEDFGEVQEAASDMSESQFEVINERDTEALTGDENNAIECIRIDIGELEDEDNSESVSYQSKAGIVWSSVPPPLSRRRAHNIINDVSR